MNKKKAATRVATIVLAAAMLLSVAVFAAPTAPTATPNTSAVLVDGKNVSFDAYNINGNNYFKLRDLAYTLASTGSRYGVDWKDGEKTITLTTGKDYASVGGEMGSKGTGTKNTVAFDGKVVVDGKTAELAAYNIDGNNYFKLRDLGKVLGFGVDWIEESRTVTISTKTEKGILMSAIVNNMGADTTAVNDQYKRFYKADSAEAGVLEIIKAGKCYINGFAIPTTAEALDAEGYKVDGKAWLTKAEGGWKVDRDTYTTYDEAAVATLKRVSNGNEVRIYDTDMDGYADLIEADYLEAVIVNSIKNNGASYTVKRANAGGVKPFDGDFFGGEGETVLAANFDKSINEGDMALFRVTPDGLVMERAVEASGKFVGGADHKYYQIGDVQYQDAMRFSRDNIVISNRCGEYTNAQKYFGFTAGGATTDITLWLTPTTDPTKTGAPAGFTSGSETNARAFLTGAIAQSAEKLNSAVVSADGAGLDISTKWVNQAAHDELDAAIKAAQAALNAHESSELLDYQVYMLYLTLHGSADDIGAKFAGYDFVGFDNQIRYGAQKLQAIHTQNGDWDATVDANYGIYMTELTDKYFEGGAVAGIEAILNAGGVYVNGIQVPTTEAQFDMNGVAGIWKADDGTWTWQAHDKLMSNKGSYDKCYPIAGIDTESAYGTFNFARRHFVLAASMLRGTTCTILAKEGEETACALFFEIKSGAQVEEITVNANGTTTVRGVPIDATSYNTDGGPNDVETRTLPTANFDQSIEEGDTVLYWEDAEGWHMERAVPVVGTMSAADHFNIIVGGTTYSDALIVRYNMQAGSRPMQFISAANNLELNDIPVTLWNTKTGYVIGISRMDNARTALKAAIEFVDAKTKGKTIVSSADGKDVDAGSWWVAEATLTAYNTARSEAAAVLAKQDATNAQMDAATQKLGAAYGTAKKGLASMQQGTLAGK